MKKHFFAASLLSILVLTIGAFSLNSNSALADPNAQAAGLASLLPPSQLVATLDAKRFFNEAVPRILTAKPELLAQFTSVLGEVQANTGIDLRQFDTVAIGANFSSKGAGSFDLDPVVLARGQVNANAIIGAAKLGGGKYKQEQVGGRTLYIFTVTRKAKDDKAGTAKPRTMEVAATAFDANTVAIGTPLRVRELIDAKAKVSPELTGLLMAKGPAVANFAAKMPANSGALVPLDNDELSKAINSIRYVFGSMDVTADAAVMDMSARTGQEAEARSLLETMQGLQMVGKALLGSSKKPENAIFVRLIDGLKMSQTTTDVNLTLSIQQADINTLVGMIK